MRRTTLTPSERSKLGVQLRNELRRVVDDDHQGLMVWVHNDAEIVTITNIPEGPITTTVGAAWHRIHRGREA